MARRTWLGGLMLVRFWGVRGSVPWATAASIGHGCNTPCLEIHDAATRETLVIDAGSGIVGLGEHLGAEPLAVPILLTHYHWDHLQGLPFFAPLFRTGWGPVVYAPVLGAGGADLVEAMFRSPFFPVPFERLPAPPAVKFMAAGERTRVRTFDVRSMELNHPGGALAFRISGTDGDLVYATDHEFGNRPVDARLAEFARGAAELIVDAHFTPAEEAAHAGWGHSTWHQCAEFARDVKAGRLWLFHHKPGRTDVELSEIEEKARRIFSRTEAAGEGDEFGV